MEPPKAATRRGLVGIALVRTLRGGPLRRSEAAALQWQDLSVEASDGFGQVHIARSHTEQEARGHVACLKAATAACLQRMRRAGAQLEDRIFAMSARTIANRIKAAAEAGGIEGRFAGHSGHVGYAQDLVARGTGLIKLQVAEAPSRSTSLRCWPLETRGEQGRILAEPV